MDRTSRQVPGLLRRLRGVALHPRHRLRATPPLAGPVPHRLPQQDPLRHPPPRTSSVRPRSPQGFPRPPTAHPSLSSPLWFLVQRELRLFRAHFHHHPPPTPRPRTKTNPSFQVSKPFPVPSLLLHPSCPHSRLKPLVLEPVCAHAVPSLGMPFLGLESSSFLVFPDIFGYYIVPPLGAHRVPLSPQVISGPVGPPMHPGGPGSAWNRAQVAREARGTRVTSLARSRIPRTAKGRRYPQPASRPKPRPGPAPTRARGTRCGLAGSTPGTPRERAAARAAAAAAAALGLPGTAPARPPGTLRPP